MDTTTQARLNAALLRMVGQTVNKSCLDCGAAMVVRRNGEKGSYFLGCGRFPDCRSTAPIPEDLKMRLLGQAELFK